MKDKKYERVVSYLIDNQEKFYRLAYSYTQNKDSALDIVQNSICKALENYSSIKNIEYLNTWFYRVLVNESLTFLKKNKKESPVDITEFDEGSHIDTPLHNFDDLYDEINTLNKDIQTVLKLHYYEGFTLKEISLIIDCNLNTVKSRLYSGLRKLKLQLQPKEV